MKRLAIIASLVAVPGVAFAGDDGSQPLNPLDPVRVLSPISIVQGDGVKVGEGTSFYPQVGLETGYVSNVFYASSDPIGAGLLRIIAEVGAGSLSPQRRSPIGTGVDTNSDLGQLAPANADAQGAFQYSANLYATWDQYLSSNDNVSAQGGLGVGAYLRGIVNPGKPLSFLAIESFDRVIRATNYESNVDTNRDINSLNLTLNYTPEGRSLGGFLRYTNVIDVFEQTQFQISNRFLNTLALRVNWRFLPLTQAYVEVSEGITTGLGQRSVKVNSYPLNAILGLNTALTVNTALVARVGYTQGFYASGPDYQTITGGAHIDYRYSPLGRIRLLYSYEHADSINANFYRDHVFQAWFDQRVQPFSLFVSPLVRLRQYQGVIGATGTNTVRDDVIFAAEVGARYQLRDWITATAMYLVTDDQTDYRYMVPGGAPLNPSYLRHEVMVGVRVAY